jgi:hypothetical protein
MPYQLNLLIAFSTCYRRGAIKLHFTFLKEKCYYRQVEDKFGKKKKNCEKENNYTRINRGMKTDHYDALIKHFNHGI